MAQISSAFWRDANGVPITTDGIVTTKSQTLSGSNATVATALFTITGTVEVRGLWGIVTTALGSNVTAAYWRLNDQTAQVDVSLNTGVTLSSAAAGSSIYRRSTAAAAAVLDNASAGRLRDSTGSSLMSLSPTLLTAKNGATTQVEFVYTTTNTPTSGVIKHFLRWLPMSDEANVTAV